MCIKVNINYSIDTNIKFEIFGSESLWTNIENDIVGKLTVRVIYRHPVYDKNSIEKFIESIESLHRKIISQKRYSFAMRDINIDLLKIETNENSRNYVNFLISSSCKCLINIPTRVNINSATILDHAFPSLLNIFYIKWSLSDRHLRPLSNFLSDFACRKKLQNRKSYYGTRFHSFWQR